MEIGNISTLIKTTPAKSKAAASTPSKNTPLKRKQDPVGGSTKKPRYTVAEECAESIPAIVLSMGNGDTGQLGLGEDIMERKRPALIRDLVDVVSIRAGGMHSVCLSKSGKVYTFGCEDEGALGRPIKEAEEAAVPGVVELPQDITVVDITAGDSHSSVLTTDGRVYIWGTFRDNNGVIGLLTPFERLLTPTRVPTDQKIIQTASGENHFVMLTDRGDVLTFGCAEQGQLGRISPNNLNRGGRSGLMPQLSPGAVRTRHSHRTHFSAVWAGAFCTIARSSDGQIYGCGLNNYRQLAVPNEMLLPMFLPLTGFNDVSRSWTAFGIGQHHTMALSADGGVWCVGRGEYGSCGQGNNEHCDSVTAVPLPSTAAVLTIAACNRTSYALLRDGTALSWGMGCNYQLGYGDDDDDSNVPAFMTGKQLEGRRIVQISPGFQHVLFRVVEGDVMDKSGPLLSVDVTVAKGVIDDAGAAKDKSEPLLSVEVTVAKELVDDAGVEKDISAPLLSVEVTVAEEVIGGTDAEKDNLGPLPMPGDDNVTVVEGAISDAGNDNLAPLSKPEEGVIVAAVEKEITEPLLRPAAEEATVAMDLISDTADVQTVDADKIDDSRHQIDTIIEEASEKETDAMVVDEVVLLPAIGSVPADLSEDVEIEVSAAVVKDTDDVVMKETKGSAAVDIEVNNNGAVAVEDETTVTKNGSIEMEVDACS